MSAVGFTSAKGSPGVTATVLALASWWPRPLVAIEADPAGGDLAARLGLPEEPGLVGLAAALRRDPMDTTLEGSPIDRYVQQTSAGVRIVTAPAGARQATAATGLLAGLAALSVPERTDLLLDLGREVHGGDSGNGSSSASTAFVDLASTTGPLAGQVDVLVWVSRPHLADLAHLTSALGHNRQHDKQPVVVLIGSGPYPADEVAAALGVTVLGQLPYDPSGASALWSSRGSVWARSALSRAARELAAALAGAVGATASDGSNHRHRAATGPSSALGSEPISDDLVGTEPADEIVAAKPACTRR